MLRYTRRNGKFFLEIVGHPDHGVPFGQDRLVLLWLATNFGSAAQILNDWGLQFNGSHYNRLAEAFNRVLGRTMFFGTKEQHSGTEIWDCSRVHFLDHMRLWLREDGGASDDDRSCVRLSDIFWGMARACGSTDADARPFPQRRRLRRVRWLRSAG